jgi:rRNA-processing protein FCF1
MAAIQFKIDIIRELGHLLGRRVEPILISPVEDELRSIATGIESKRSREAGQALKLAHMMQVETVTMSPNESVDETLTRVALERRLIVATNDRLLRRKLGELAVPSIYLRKKSHLEVKGIIK